MKRVETFDILGVNVSVLNLDLAEAAVARMIAEREKGYVCVAPVATIMDCQKDPLYRAVVNAASLVTPDGMPVVWLGRLAGHRAVARTYGPDLMLLLCDRGRRLGWKHFFYGATPEICDKLERSLKERFPGLDIAGMIAPPFTPCAEPASAEVIAGINAARPDIVWVGLGSPKQDLWCALNRRSLEAPVLIGIGAAFDFLSGTKPMAPRWMQAAGLEWLFRLCCEPRRLWRRYLVGNAQFVGLLLLGLFKRKKRG